MNENTKKTCLTVAKVFSIICLVSTCIGCGFFTIFSMLNPFALLVLGFIALDIYFFVLAKKVYEEYERDEYTTKSLVIDIFLAIFFSRVAGIIYIVIYCMNVNKHSYNKVDNQAYTNNKTNYQEEVQDIKCPNCRHYSPVNSNFCSFCGQSLIQNEKSKCPNCGAEISNNAHFCNACGTPIVFEEVSEKPSKSEPTLENDNNTNIMEEPPKTRKTVLKTVEYCKICGSEIPEGATQCQVCGHDFTLDKWI